MLDKIKEIIDSKNQTAYMLLISIFVVIVVMIVSIVFIWKGTFKKDNKVVEEVINFETGKYLYKKVLEKDIIIKYSENIAKLLEKGNDKELYNLVSKDFLKFKGMTENTFNSYIKSKKIYMEKIKVGKYISCKHNRLGKIFEVEFLNEDETITEKIIFIEKSPNNFTISFDSFIGIDNAERKIVKDGIQLKVKEIKEFVTEVEIIAEFKNVTNGNLIINENNYYEPLYLKFNNNEEVVSDSSIFVSKTKELGVNDYISPTMKFRVDRLSSGLMKSIVLKNVYSEVTKEDSNVEFSLK